VQYPLMEYIYIFFSFHSFVPCLTLRKRKIKKNGSASSK
jgi:hypothetical protein